MFNLFNTNKTFTFKRRITIFLFIGLLILALAPYAVIPFLLPGSADPNSKLFSGEWFNKTKPLTADQYQTLNRWAHYYGHHGCEPEVGDCQYKGVIGKWKLVLNYSKEEKPFPVNLFSIGKSEVITVSKQAAVKKARDHIKQRAFYKNLPSNKLILYKAELVKLTKNESLYWRILFVVPGVDGNISVVIKPRNEVVVSCGFTKKLDISVLNTWYTYRTILE